MRHQRDVERREQLVRALKPQFLKGLLDTLVPVEQLGVPGFDKEFVDAVRDSESVSERGPGNIKRKSKLNSSAFAWGPWNVSRPRPW